MKKVKLFLTIIAVALISTITFAESEIGKVLIRESNREVVNLRASLDANETMLVVISNEDGEIVLEDEISDSPRSVIKNYDFNRARFGIYTIEVFINDDLVQSTVVYEDAVKTAKYFNVEVR